MDSKIFTYDDFYTDLKNSGLKHTDTVMIHSAFSSIKNIEGGAKTILAVLKEYFSKGLVLIPTHTWATIKEDEEVMDKEMCNSCVGYLTNEAIKDKDFIRSNHPTHSVVAYGVNARKYIEADNYANTPVNPNGSFGKLKNGGKILFIGAPLSKNTFVHSVEEEMNVPDRFTEHIYTFYTKDNNDLYEFHMPRHFNAKCPHISDNYEKLLPIMIENNIAKKVKILYSISYLVDAKGCRELVIKYLKDDIHAFDDDRELKKVKLDLI